MESALDHRLPIRAAALIGLLAAILFCITLAGGYTADDTLVVLKDERLHEPGKWLLYFTTDYWKTGVDNLYRPLTSLSYKAQWALHGDRPWAFHLVNILLHGLVSAGVVLLGANWFGRRAGWIAGLLFAVHPVHTEVVSTIVGRADLFSTAAILFALIVISRVTWRLWALIVFCIIAIFTKETGILVPLMLALIAFLQRRAGESPPQKATLLIATMLWLLAVYLAAREMSHLNLSWNRNDIDWTINPLIRASGIDLLLVPLVILGRYTAMLFIPFNFSWDYGGYTIGSVARLNDPHLWVGVAIIVTWLVLFITACIRRHRQVALCLLFLGMSYGLIANWPIVIGTIMAERLLYLPSVFFVMLLAAMLSKLPGRTPATISIIIAIGWGIIAFNYATQFHDQRRLMQYAIDRNPIAVLPRLAIAQDYAEGGQYTEAHAALAPALAHYDGYWKAHYILSEVYEKQGDLDGAIAAMERASQLNPAPVLLRQVERLRALQDEPAPPAP